MSRQKSQPGETTEGSRERRWNESKSRGRASTQDRASESASIEQFQRTAATGRNNQCKTEARRQRRARGDTRQEAKDGKFEQKSEHRGIGEECLGAANQRREQVHWSTMYMKWWKRIIDSLDEVHEGRSSAVRMQVDSTKGYSSSQMR